MNYIVEPSKIGKTVLCENVIGQEHMISMSKNDFSKERFLTGNCKKAGISMFAEISEENADISGSAQRSATVTKNYFAAKGKDSLKNWKKMSEPLGSLYQAVYWKDDTIYVLDNMFLFYIRWDIRQEKTWK